MTFRLLLVYTHLGIAVLYGGFFLFWVIMARARAGNVDDTEVDLDWEALKRATWPPRAGPVHVTLPGLGWILLGLSLVSGAALLVQSIDGRMVVVLDGVALTKLVLVAMLGPLHYGLSRNRSPRAIRAGAAVFSAVVVISAWLRG